MFSSTGKIDIQEISEPFLEEAGITLSMLRLDKVHPHISGNKWFKLKYNFIEAKNKGLDSILTFGGAFSNHIAATAAAGKEYGFKTIGIIRGEQASIQNPTLSFAREQGMELHFVDRDVYREKSSPEFIKHLEAKFGKFYLVPEGGTNSLAIKGASEIYTLFDSDKYDLISTSIGTGGTIAGLIKSLPEKNVWGFSSLKGDFVHGMVRDLLDRNYSNCSIFDQYHFGGFAKVKPELIEFMNAFKRMHQIQLEPIYTGKMLWGIYDLARQGNIAKGTRILAIHTGGLQGLHGMKNRYPTLDVK